jgi:glycosyltransferase involved in cell wall biosynthesis
MMVSILMPVYNERERVARAIREVLLTEFGTGYELIVVDDGSTDGTGQILRELGDDERVRLFRHPANRGKGAAIRTALAQARGNYTAIHDADLEYSAADLSRLMTPLIECRANACFGVRIFTGESRPTLLYLTGNRAVTLTCNVLFGVRLRDIASAQKMIRTTVFRSLPLRACGFGIDAEITARLVQRGERIVQIPVRYRARSSGEGKKLSARDGLPVMGQLVRCRFSAA